jgi:nitrogen PTS system EIIA component
MTLTVKDAARVLAVSEKTIYRWVDQGILPAYRVNDRYRFNRAELLEWATSRRMNVSPDILQEPESDGVALPSLSSALKAGGITYRLEGADKESVLRSLVEVMRLPDSIDRDFLFQVLLAREALGSTGLGNGIAIPHVRNPIVLHVPQPTVNLCFLAAPVEFGALDGQPVHTLFSLISPTVRAHLHLLSRLAYALRDPGFSGVIARQGSRDEIMNELARIETHLPAPAPAAHEEPE